MISNKSGTVMYTAVAVMCEKKNLPSNVKFNTFIESLRLVDRELSRDAMALRTKLPLGIGLNESNTSRA